MPKGKRIPTDDLLDDIRRVAEIVGGEPSLSDYHEHGAYSDQPIRSRFGTWVAGKDAAGVIETGPIPTKERIRRDIQNVADDLGRTPSCTEYDDLGLFTTAIVRGRFETWTAAVEAAGMEPRGAGAGVHPLEDTAPEELGLSPIGERA